MKRTAGIAAAGLLAVILAGASLRAEVPALITLTFDTRGWSQDEINYIQSAVSYLLAQDGITHQGVACIKSQCVILKPSNAPRLTGPDILDLKTLNDAAEAAYLEAHPE
jgi:hypothetical protein